MAPEPKNAESSATHRNGRGLQVGSVLEARYRLKRILGEGGSARCSKQSISG